MAASSGHLEKQPENWVRNVPTAGELVLVSERLELLEKGLKNPPAFRSQNLAFRDMVQGYGSVQLKVGLDDPTALFQL